MATRRRRRSIVRVLTPLADQVVNRARSALTELLAGLPAETLIAQEKRLITAAREALSALFAREAQGALFDDGSTSGSLTREQLAALDRVRASGGSSSVAAPPPGGSGDEPAPPPPPPPPPFDFTR